MDILSLNIDRDEPQASPSEIRLQVAFIAAIAAVAASLVARFVFGAPLVPELLAQFFFAVAPIWMVEAAVALLGPSSFISLRSRPPRSASFDSRRQPRRAHGAGGSRHLRRWSTCSPYSSSFLCSAAASPGVTCGKARC